MNFHDWGSSLRFVESAKDHLIERGSTAFATDYSILRQPSQSFSTSFKNQKFSTREATQIPREFLRNVLCSGPCGLLDVWFVKDGSFLHDTNTLLIEGCSREIGEYQDWTTGTLSHNVRNRSENVFDFRSWTEGKVYQKNLLTPMSDETNTVGHVSMYFLLLA
jgi:hypothetical protein